MLTDILNQEQVWDSVAESWKERRKKIGPSVIKFIEQAHGNLLDLGCGSGRHLMKNDRVTYYLVDFSQNMLELAETKAKAIGVQYKIIKQDICKKLPFEDNFFEQAIYISVLHCLPNKSDRSRSLKELYRVLKKGGIAILAVWNKEHGKFKRFKNKKEILLAWNIDGKRNLRYYYFYDREEFLDLLRSTGFKIIDIKDNPEDTGLFVKVEK